MKIEAQKITIRGYEFNIAPMDEGPCFKYPSEYRTVGNKKFDTNWLSPVGKFEGELENGIIYYDNMVNQFILAKNTNQHHCVYRTFWTHNTIQDALDDLVYDRAGERYTIMSEEEELYYSY